MPAFLFALVTVALTSFGGRDQLLVADLSARQGQRVGLLLVGCIIAVLTAGAMALSGQYIASMLPSAGKTMLVAFALLAATFELAWPVKTKKPEEPTYSLGATAIVMLARQVGDGSRFLIFAFAAWSGTPWFAAAGGAVGGIIAIAAGWAMAEDLQAVLPVKLMRRALAGIVLVVGVYVALSARGIIV